MDDSKIRSCTQNASLKSEFELAYLEQLLIKNHNHKNSNETLHKTCFLFLVEYNF